METTNVLESREAELVKDALNVHKNKDSILSRQQRELEQMLVKLLTSRDALNLSTYASEAKKIKMAFKTFFKTLWY